jgi:ABC-type polysaccharide/polyol phosphate export permease
VVGITLLMAALQAFVRDVEHVLMPVLMILMYTTPSYPLLCLSRCAHGR